MAKAAREEGFGEMPIVETLAKAERSHAIASRKPWTYLSSHTVRARMSPTEGSWRLPAPLQWRDRSSNDVSALETELERVFDICTAAAAASAVQRFRPVRRRGCLGHGEVAGWTGRCSGRSWITATCGHVLHDECPYVPPIPERRLSASDAAGESGARGTAVSRCASARSPHRYSRQAGRNPGGSGAGERGPIARGAACCWRSSRR